MTSWERLDGLMKNDEAWHRRHHRTRNVLGALACVGVGLLLDGMFLLNGWAAAIGAGMVVIAIAVDVLASNAATKHSDKCLQDMESALEDIRQAEEQP